MRHWCPDYVDAVNSEQLDRSRAFLGEPESIVGIPVVALTPWHWDLLISKRNGYALGRAITSVDTIQFLCFVATEFDYSNPGKARAWIGGNALLIDYDQAAVEIFAYLDRVFMDAVSGEPCKPYYGLSASLCYKMAREPYVWPIEETLKTSLRIIYQLLRPVAQANGLPLINPRSDKVEIEALAEMDRRRKAEEITEDQFKAISAAKPGGQYHA